MSKKNRDRWPESYRWALVENFRKRSDESANLLRALLILISGSSVGFLLNKHYDQMPNLHGISMLFFGLSIGATIWSWDLQKFKSIERLKALRDIGYDAYMEREKYFATTLRNSFVDALTYFLIWSGVLTEIVLAFCRSSSQA